MDTKKLLLLFFIILIIGLEISSYRIKRRRRGFRPGFRSSRNRLRISNTRISNARGRRIRNRPRPSISRPARVPVSRSCNTEFNYKKEFYRGKGPNNWYKLSSCYKTCKYGSRQSPININTRSARPTSIFIKRISFKNSGNTTVEMKITNHKSHSPEFKPTSNGFVLVYGRQKYNFKNLHIHLGKKTRERVGSEHSIDGKFTAMEAQMVFSSPKRRRYRGYPKYVVVAVRLRISKDPSFDDPEENCRNILQKKDWMANSMTFKEGRFGASECVENRALNFSRTLRCAYTNSAVRTYNSGRTVRAYVDVLEMLPPSLDGNHQYYTYGGSLTTPPCNESVQWIVMKCPVTVSKKVLEALQKVQASKKGELISKWGTRRPIQRNYITVYTSFW